jgi:hypothetical protein
VTIPTEEPRSVFYQAFTRDGAKCMYCDRNIMESYDSFSASCLDHLKPRKHGGPCDDPWNRVTACVVCNNLKGSFDPSPDGTVTPETFGDCVVRAREYIWDKRQGTNSNSFYRDYQYWRNELKLTNG